MTFELDGGTDAADVRMGRAKAMRQHVPDDEWRTPLGIFGQLDREFRFDRSTG